MSYLLAERLQLHVELKESETAAIRVVLNRLTHTVLCTIAGLQILLII